MARFKKPKPKKQPKSFSWHNGGGTEPFNTKCEGCEHVQPDGEQYKHPKFQATPCRVCGSITALYEPQLR